MNLYISTVLQEMDFTLHHCKLVKENRGTSSSFWSPVGRLLSECIQYLWGGSPPPPPLWSNGQNVQMRRACSEVISVTAYSCVRESTHSLPLVFFLCALYAMCDTMCSKCIPSNMSGLTNNQWRCWIPNETMLSCLCCKYKAKQKKLLFAGVSFIQAVKVMAPAYVCI